MVDAHTKVRVRFAPSPTGHLHVGGLRTALFNFLFARHMGGTFLIRVEDTDIERSKPEYVQSQLASLEWCGIVSDEPLVFQSQRFSVYSALAQQLLAEKKIYRCRCSSDEVESRLKQSGITDPFFGYDGHCRDKQYDESKPFALRFLVSDTFESIVVQDLILGELVFTKSQLDDFIIVRSDGSPTYNFAVVVDDMFMGITHVIRAQEHIPNTPKQILLYRACGSSFEPQFAHIPLILGTDGQKLSKRDGAVDVLAYKKLGYLPQALVNYMVRLGWAHGDQEVFTLEQLVASFTLEAVGKKPAIFDSKKLEWMNTVYLKQLSTKACYEWLVSDVGLSLSDFSSWSVDQVETALSLYKERVVTGAELISAVRCLCQGPDHYDQEAIAQCVNSEVLLILESLVREWQTMALFDHMALAECIKQFCVQHSIKMPVIAQPIRIALAGKPTGAGLFDMLAVVGKTESSARVMRFVTSVRA